MRENGADSGATILSFVPRPAPAHRLGVAERLVALQWAATAREHGVRAVHIHDPEPGDDPGVGSFLLIYSGEDLWANWGVCTARGGFEVWRPGSGATVGWFAALGDALAVILRTP